MTTRDETRLTEVKRFYAERLARGERSGSGPASGAPPLAPDYSAEALAALPDGVASSSFGCGDPLALAGVREGETVLDLGCGAGLDLILAAEKTGPTGSVIGVDVSEDMLARARQNTERAGLSNVTLLQGAIEELPVADASVDRVISNCVVNLSMNKPAAFREIARVLRPGGTMLISDLVAEPLPDWLSAHSDLYAACVSGAVEEETYLGDAAGAGLAELKVLDAMAYDEALVRQLIADELPVAIGDLAARLGLERDQLLDLAAKELSGKIKAIKLFGRRV